MSDAVDPNDLGRGPAITAVGWLLTSVCIVTISLRFYVRTSITRSLSSDDWTMLIAVVSSHISHQC